MLFLIAVANKNGCFMDKNIKNILNQNHPGESEFHQAVIEIYEDITEFYQDHSKYTQYKVMEQLLEPDRVIRFRVGWEDDNHQVQVNRGWRVQYQNILGPYKGGIRFSAGVNESIFKFLGFEQCFKNALTNFPIGGGKGGSDFNPKGKSEHEIRRFCCAFINELYKYLGHHHDVPAGDIGVGVREIGFMFGQYIKLTDQYTGVFTGKGTTFGGSCGREHATGYGCIYFLNELLKEEGESIKDKKIAISGAGNVALYAAQKCLIQGAKVITLSDSGGLAHFKKGLTQTHLKKIMDIKFNQHGALKSLCEKESDIDFFDNQKPWGIDCDIALPCATQNEVQEEDMKNLIKNGVKVVCEGANMPLTAKAIDLIQENDILYGPGKAANAGGVAVSVLEQQQNIEHITWSFERVDQELKQIMRDIHQRCVEYARQNNGHLNYKKGANIWSFKRLANAMAAYGIK